MDVKFYPPRQGGTKILAFADVTFGDGIVVRGFRIVDGANGLFASVPSRQVVVEGKPRYWNQVAFVDAAVRERFLGELVDRYLRWRETSGEAEPAAAAPAADEG